MCGIVHVRRRDGKVANRTVLKRFNKQSHRGTQGFGFIELHKGIVGAEIRTKTEKEIKEKLAFSKADEIMFHHRYPTSTPNFVEATHPILVSHKDLRYDYYVMHNGMISNDGELKAKHIDKGFIYTTAIYKKWVTRDNVYGLEMFNDSEAMAIDFCLSIETGTEMTAKGSIALVALQFEKDTRKAKALFFGRNNGNPLKIEDSSVFLCISSETGTEIPKDTLFRFDYETSVITKADKKIGNYLDYSSGHMGYNNSYSYYGYGDETDYSYKPGKSFKDIEPAEEEDIDIDLYEEREELLQALRECEAMGDYDGMTDISMRINEIDMELDDVEATDFAEAEKKKKTELMEGDIEELGVGRHIKQDTLLLGDKKGSKR